MSIKMCYVKPRWFKVLKILFLGLAHNGSIVICYKKDRILVLVNFKDERPDVTRHNNHHIIQIENWGILKYYIRHLRIRITNLSLSVWWTKEEWPCYKDQWPGLNSNDLVGYLNGSKRNPENFTVDND